MDVLADETARKILNAIFSILEDDNVDFDRYVTLSLTSDTLMFGIWPYHGDGDLYGRPHGGRARAFKIEKQT